MPAGLPYFAWIDPSETTFTSGHMRWDESVFSFRLSQEEGDPASLTVEVRKPKNSSGDLIGLLGPGRKIWCWFAFDCDGTNLIKFRGRLVGIPTSLFEELVTLEFVAKPIDLVSQKNSLAASLRVLPFYDEAVIDPAKRSDPEVVLEGYTKIWHYNPETHVMTVSDEITGEDGRVDFDALSDTGKVLYDGLALSLASGPLARVDVTAEYNWTQQAAGTVDLTNHLRGRWPQKGMHGAFGWLSKDDWPKRGTGIGDGWMVADATARNLFDWTTTTHTTGSELIIHWPDGSVSDTTQTQTITAPSLGMPVGQTIVTENRVNVSYGEPEADEFGVTPPFGDVTSSSSSYAATTIAVGTQQIVATLTAGYIAARSCTELISFTLFADVQPILTDPEDGEALRIDDVRSVNLTDSGYIGDARRRSYIATDRGNQSLEHLIALARAHLMKRARVVEITFAPKLARMSEITLRKNAFIADPRVGQATGKIISYSVALDGSDGKVNCEVKIGCTIGRGGMNVITAGVPTYCTIDYAGADYQQFLGRKILVDSFVDSSVGYEPPLAAPNDDGINFLNTVSAEQFIEVPLTVHFGPEPGDIPKMSNPIKGSDDEAQDKIAAVTQMYQNTVLPQYNTQASFKLKSMSKSFSTNYNIGVTDLKIPTGYNLEAT